ncbi:MAG: 50S ribosomal protein L23 [Proteobacteria bacterium]|jgi:large subunit ribosomal protein L23|nr:50S ribosomal protein L23 [Pseudomonadota bacterium]
MIDIKHYNVILGPIITEKSTFLSENNVVTFKVPLAANKAQIKAAVEALFTVKVDKVNTIRVHGKTKRFKGVMGRRSDTKKALVKLVEGHSIDVTTGV